MVTRMTLQQYTGLSLHFCVFLIIPNLSGAFTRIFFRYPASLNLTSVHLIPCTMKLVINSLSKRWLFLSSYEHVQVTEVTLSELRIKFLI